MKPIYRIWCVELNCYLECDYRNQDGMFLSADGLIWELGKKKPLKNQNDYTIEHCSGLKDVDGNWIHEGDIIKYSFDDIEEDEDGNVLKEYHCVGEAAILFDYSGEFMFFTEEGRHMNLWYSSEIADEIKVIGNIHENPELLKETEDES